MAKGQVSFEFLVTLFVSLILIIILSYSVLNQKNSLSVSKNILTSSYIAEADARAVENSMYSGFVMDYSFSDNASYRLENGLMHYRLGEKVIEINGVFYSAKPQ